MKNLKLQLIALLSIASLISSCGGSNEKIETKSITIKPSTVEIKGDLSDYFEVVDREYVIPVTESSFDQLITVELRRKEKDFAFDTEKTNPFGTESEDQKYHVGFGIEILDKNGPVQVNNATDDGLSGPYSSEDIVSLLKLKKGERGTIRWSIDETEGIKSFRISSALKKANGMTYVQEEPSEEIIAEEILVPAESKNWDQVLNDYDKYVNDYVKFYKKAKNGDTDAIKEYPILIDKANKLQSSLEKAKNDNSLSATQSSRMMKIQMKMLTAIQEK